MAIPHVAEERTALSGASFARAWLLQETLVARSEKRRLCWN
jgi:hypothetical protein